jgi:hypothetical protein
LARDPLLRRVEIRDEGPTGELLEDLDAAPGRIEAQLLVEGRWRAVAMVAGNEMVKGGVAFMF